MFIFFSQCYIFPDADASSQMAGIQYSAITGCPDWGCRELVFYIYPFAELISTKNVSGPCLSLADSLALPFSN